MPVNGYEYHAKIFAEEYTQGVKMEFSKIQEAYIKNQLKAEKAAAELRRKQEEEREKNRKEFKTRKVKDGYEVLLVTKKRKVVLITVATQTEALKLMNSLEMNYGDGFGRLYSHQQWEPITFTRYATIE